MTAVEDITVQPTENPNCRVYNTRYELSSVPERGYRGCPGELGAFGQLVLEVDGVVQVTIGPYVLVIDKAPLFSWEDVEGYKDSEGGVLFLLSEFVRSQRVSVEM